MSKELREAAELVLNADVDELEAEMHGEDVALNYEQSARQLARAYLAANPPDGGEPVDEQFFRERGFDWSDDWAWGMRTRAAPPEWEASKRFDDTTILFIRETETCLSIGRDYWPCMQIRTRRDFYKLCEVLAIGPNDDA